MNAAVGTSGCPKVRPSTALPVVALLILTTAHAAAQYYERPLTEQDLERVVPVLQADKAGTERLARQAADREALERTRTGARQQAAGQIKAGTDPLEWLRKLTPNAAAPSTARYDAGCSRALTAQNADPSAVFTFGLAAPSAWLIVWKTRDQSIPIGERGQPGAQRPGATRAESVAQQSRSFYSSRNFEYEGEIAPFQWQLMAPDRFISATVMGVNVLGRLDACRALASGPTIVLKAEGEAFGRGPSQPGPAANRELDRALDKAGLGEPEYLNLKLQLLAARADARDPGRLKAPAAATEEQMKALAIRRQNVEFYRRHEAGLDALLAALRSS